MINQYITLTDAVALTGLSRQRIYQLYHAGIVRRGPVAGRLGYHRYDLLNYLAAPKSRGGRPPKQR